MNAFSRIVTILAANSDFEFKLRTTESDDPNARWYAELYDSADETVQGYGYGRTSEDAMAECLLDAAR